MRRLFLLLAVVALACTSKPTPPTTVDTVFTKPDTVFTKPDTVYAKPDTVYPTPGQPFDVKLSQSAEKVLSEYWLATNTMAGWQPDGRGSAENPSVFCLYGGWRADNYVDFLFISSAARSKGDGCRWETGGKLVGVMTFVDGSRFKENVELKRMRVGLKSSPQLHFVGEVHGTDGEDGAKPSIWGALRDIDDPRRIQSITIN